MREFAERFGDSERMDLETTFRCSEPIAAVATRFVLANPAQIRKTVRSTRQLQGPCVHIGLSGDRDRSLLSEALGRIAADAAGYEGPSQRAAVGPVQAHAAGKPARSCQAASAALGSRT